MSEMTIAGFFDKHNAGADHESLNNNRHCKQCSEENK